MEYRYTFGGETIVIQVQAAGDGFAVMVGGRAYQVKTSAARPGELDLTLGGDRRCLAYVAADGASRWVALASGEAAGQTWVLSVPDTRPRSRRAQSLGHEALQAQMPGFVRRVLVTQGEAVARGQVLLLLEAMKIEIRVTAPHAGVVERVAVAAGQAVERGQALVELVSQPDEPG